MTTSRRPTAGMQLGGRYRLVEPLPGAAGRSWRARDDITTRDVIARAVAIPDDLADTEQDRTRRQVLRDIGALSERRHPGIEHVIDAVVDRGVPWILTDPVEGRSLGDVVRRDGPLPAGEVARIGLRVLDTLVAASLPHGDVNPDDVLLGPDGQVTVTGFGANPVDGTGTRGFRAPEGGPGRVADLWALGATLHFAVEGRMPDGPMARARALRPALEAMLAQDPMSRPDPATVWHLLKGARGAPAEIPAPPPSPPAPPPSPPAPPPSPPAPPPSPPAPPPSPPAPPPSPPAATGITDPEVAAALAAFEAAIEAAKPRGRAAAEPAPGPGSAPSAGTGGTVTAGPAADPASSDGPRPGDAAAAVSADRTGAPGRPPAPAGSTAAPEPTPPTTPAHQPEPQPDHTTDRPATHPTASEGRRQGSTIASEPALPTASARPAATHHVIDEAELRPDGTAADRPTRPGSPAAARTPGPAAAEPTASGDDRARPDGRRRVGAIAALVLLAVLAAALIALALNRDGDAAPAASAARPTGTAQPSTGSSGPQTPAAPPAGYRLYRDSAGWSVAVPSGWQATDRGAMVTFTDGVRTLGVTRRTDPPQDPYDDAIAREPVVQAATPGYEVVRIARVSYRSWPAADWEYTAGSGLDRVRTLTRSVVTGPGQAYALSLTTADRSWATDRTYFDVAASTFSPDR